jgi:expansin (peptidoglycan-binding protein)
MPGRCRADAGPKTERIACNQPDADTRAMSVDRQRYRDTPDDHLSAARMQVGAWGCGTAGDHGQADAGARPSRERQDGDKSSSRGTKWATGAGTVPDVLADVTAAVKAVFALLAMLAAAAGGTALPAAPHRAAPADGAASAHAVAPAHGAAPARSAAPRRTVAPAHAATTKGPVVRGRATHYGPASTGGNCSFPSVPRNRFTVAAGPGLYAGGAACGGYLDVSSGRRTIRVKITDQCPECGQGHLDLTDEAFAALAPLGRGLIPITYRIVTNPQPAATLSFRVKEGSSRYWLALLVDGAGNRLRSLELRRGNRWTALQRTDYGYWVAPSGAGTGPFTIRVSDVAAHHATAAGIRLRPGAVQRTAVRLYR